MATEIWKDIPEFKGHYQASSLGRIRSIKFNRKKVMKPTWFYGYYVVKLHMNGKQIMKKVHRLIAFALVENPDNKNVVHHKNHDKLDNNATNLQWVSSGENQKFAWDAGMRDKPIGIEIGIITP